MAPIVWYLSNFAPYNLLPISYTVAEYDAIAQTHPTLFVLVLDHLFFFFF